MDVRGVPVPTMLYGTAWKEAQTERLVAEALCAGFAGIDTANQRKHYCEEDVGRALRAHRAPGASGSDPCALEQVARPFLQTKFTYRRGQDERLPYDPDAPLGVQVRQSFSSSLAHLGVDRIDSYLLHGPEADRGLSVGDIEVWRTMESLHDAGLVRLIGVSNIRADQLGELLRIARIPPAFVQNRYYFRPGPYAEACDRGVRALCDGNDVVYQGFSLLTANREIWGHKALHPIARNHGCTPAQVVLRYAMHIGILPLTGTTDSAHMRADLACTGLTLDPDEQAVLAGL
ncbi:MAG: aldo/keto reductase [Myxococcales bacterium]|nr:aldo/keto reductase [Myxococcales bacterium]